jgi:aspartate carbamoyltransferase catalytic subunit
MKGSIAVSRLGGKKDVHFGRVTGGAGLFRQHPRQAFLDELTLATAGLTHAKTSCR